MTLSQRPLRRGLLRTTLYAIAVAALAACGGGGGGGESSAIDTGAQLADQSPVSTAAAIPHWDGKLIISEVGSNYYSDDVAWLEIYNPNNRPVSLASYTLSSSHVDVHSGSTSLTPMLFSLPDVSVAPGAFIVLAAKPHAKLTDGGQIVYLRQGNKVPYWNGSGSLELLLEERSVDFVRFGRSLAMPKTEGEWIEDYAVTMPTGADQHGKAIVRPAASGMVDTNSGNDWRAVNFGTPAGPNDVAPGVVDSDRDGIPDSAKVAGGTYGGIDLYAMGARPGRRDAFMEIDYMQGSDPALVPRREALQKVVDAFAARNIALHIDTGSLYGASFDPAAFNLGGGGPVPFSKCMELDIANIQARTGCSSFYGYKGAAFDVRRKLVFHYAIFANSQRLDGGAGSSGVAELHGADLIVSLGGYGFTGAPGVDLNMLTNLQASTLMHEFGHNLGLRHGGNEDINYKPNHYSVMNYIYQFAGLSATPNSPYAAERYYLVNGLKGKNYCNLVENSPCSSDFVIDFSNGSSAALDERSLSEAANIGRGSRDGAYADWDANNALTGGAFGRNLNLQYDSVLGVLKDYDEWSNLSFTFSRGHSGASQGIGPAETEPERRPNPMNNSARNPTQEDPLPQHLHDALQMLHYWRQ